MRNLYTFLAIALSFSAVSCNPAADTEGLQRRGSSVTANASPGDIVLTWNGDSAVTSYEIYFGQTQTGSFTKAATLSSFDKAAPGMALSREDLKLTKGSSACFYIVARNAGGGSLPSDTVCGTVPN